MKPVTKVFMEKMRGDIEVLEQCAFASLVFLRNPDALGPRGVKAYKAIASISVVAKWYAAVLVFFLNVNVNRKVGRTCMWARSLASYVIFFTVFFQIQCRSIDQSSRKHRTEAVHTSGHVGCSSWPACVLRLQATLPQPKAMSKVLEELCTTG